MACLVCVPGLVKGQDSAVDQTPWKLDVGHVYGGSSGVSGARLMDPVVMDFDGDGIDDVIFGAPGMSPNGVTAAGSLYIVRGSKTRTLTGSLDMTRWQSLDYRIDGHTRNGQFGMNLVTGDFNGDGKTDVAVAEPGQKGAVYLFYGGQTRTPGIYDVRQKGASNVAFVSTDANSLLGLSMCVGDFNRDGIDDIAIASISQQASTGGQSSIVTMLTMRREWDKETYDIGSKIYGKTVISRPIASNIRVVHTCAAGDFNDDGVTDIALGMPLDSYQGNKAAGSVSLIYQPFRYNGTVIDIARVDEKNGIRISGNQANAQFGYALASADFTGDGRDDLAIAAPGRLVTGPDNEGVVYILNGNELPSESGAQPEMMQITGKGGNFGFRLKSEDVNGDKRKDLVVMAPQAGIQNNGAFYTWFGGPHLVEAIEQKSRADIEVDGAEFMGFGLGASFGDVNGDGKIDAVVRLASDPDNREMTGALAVLGNISEYPATSSLSDNFLTVVAPSQGGRLSGHVKKVQYQGETYRAWFSPLGAGNRSIICLTRQDRPFSDDIALASENGCDKKILGPENYQIADFDITVSPDGKPWLTIGVPEMPVNNATGFVAVIPMPESLDQPLALNLNAETLKTSAMTYILSKEEAGGLGMRIQWQDLDGDGMEDLMIGAPRRIIDAEQSGSLFIVKGTAAHKMGFHELTSSEVIQYEGFMNEQFGGQWRVLDMNRDGELDLAVTAPRAVDASGDEYATVYVVYSAGLRAPKRYGIKSPDLAALRIMSPQNLAGLEVIDQGVDINEDGFDDLVLLSPDFRAGLQRQGKVMVLFASEDFRGGELKLSNESYIGFSYTSGRNERIVDARFVYNSEQLQFMVVSSDLGTGLNHTLSSFVTHLSNHFYGEFTASKLTRTQSDAKMPIPVRLIYLPDADKKQDEIWLHFPYDGVDQSDQGVARHLLPWKRSQ